MIGCAAGLAELKVISKFFLKQNKSLDGISGITKNIIFFHLKACERRNFDFYVFLRGVVCPDDGIRGKFKPIQLI